MNKYLKEAIQQYEHKIESGEPFYMEAATLIDIEEYYEKQGREYDAERLMRFAEKIHPDNEDVLVVKAYRLKSKGEWAQALSIIKGIHNQLNRDVQLFYVEWDVASGRLERAEKRIQDCLAPQLSAETYEWYLDLGEIFLDYGFQSLSLKYLNAIPVNFQFSNRVNELVADAYYQLQQYDKSLKAANQLVDADPYDTRAWVQLADIQQKCERYEDCMQSCDYALAIDADNVRAMSLKVFAMFALQQGTMGLQQCMEYVKKCPNDYSLRMYAGEQLHTLQREPEALRMLQDALRLCPIENPDHMRIVTDMVYVLIATNQDEEAEVLMQNLCMLGTSLCQVYMQLAEIYFQNEAFDKAIKILSKYMQHNEATVNEADCANIIQLLIQQNCISQAPDLWNALAQKKYSPSAANVHPYLAYAMFVLKDKLLFSQEFGFAMTYAPQALLQVFGSQFQTYKLEEILTKINRVFEEDKN